jgi:hypothetical protein
LTRATGFGKNRFVAHLFIVARDQPSLFAYLSREFAGEPEVTVILDRRQADRRPGHEAESEATVGEQEERRRQRGLVRQLATLGYAFVRLGSPVAH